ncbi:MAG: tetratricopeptide repeat protein [Flavobacteriaceae bacterium]|nr:tetratricopeptide repeat protein [Flavobacteriaceae bacterium]
MIKKGILIFFVILNLNAQDQRVADSLVQYYNKNTLNNLDKLELLKELSFNELKSADLSLQYADELITLAKSLNNNYYLYRGYLRKGETLEDNGEINEALDIYFKAAEIAVKLNTRAEGIAYLSVADVYSLMEDTTNSNEYYKKSIGLLRIGNDSIPLASALLNAGDDAFNSNNFDLALHYFEESGLIFNKVDYLTGKAYNLGNIGMVYAEQGKDNLAEQNINAAITILEKQEDYYPVCVYLTYMADIYVKKNDLSSAFSYAQRSLDLAKKYQLKDQIGDAHLKLSELYEQNGDQTQSFAHYKNHIVYRDSVKNIEEVQKIANLRTDYEVSQKQGEVDLLEEKKKAQNIILYATLGVLLLIGVLAMGLFKRNKFIKATNKIIEGEKARSDKLLLNILPQETADELKTHGKVKAKHFQSVTVLFTDFEGFTKYSEHLSPEALVETIDYYFSGFDKIIKKHNLEKIKTIGDAYMCAGGLPFPSDDHAKRVINAAFEIAAFVDKIQKEVDKEHLNFNVRIGINTGPVVAGVVGSTKFAYDIWGDTVNIAARMESNSGLGKINISENTYQIIKDDFECEYRGEIDAKNKGMMKMYFVSAKKHKEAIKILANAVS